MAKVAVVVVNYRTPQDLTRFVESFHDCNARVLADRGPSQEGEVGLILVDVDPVALYDPGLRVHWAVQVNENIGYGRACNLGVAQSEHMFNGLPDYYMLCNADIEWRPRVLDELVLAMERNPRWGVLGPRQVDQDGRLVHAGIFGTRAAPRHRGWKELDRGQHHEVIPAVTVSGSAYLVRRACWEELASCRTYLESLTNLGLAQSDALGIYGGFLPTPFYYEETWCSYHAVEHGWAVMYYGAATLVHRWHSAVKTNNAEMWASQQMFVSQQMFRQACRHHLIPCD